MGVATAISLGLAAVGTGMSVYQGIQGSKAEAKANEAAATAAQDAKRLAELDKFAALNVPTLGLELATQNMQAWQQSQIQALKESGAAGVLGGLTAANQQAQAQNQQLAAQADQMQYQRDLVQAQNAQQIESDRIARQAGLVNAQLGGAQAAAAEGRQAKAQGTLGAAQALSSAAQLYAYQDIYGNKKTPQTFDPNAAAKTQPNVASQSYQMPGSTQMPSGQIPQWQLGNRFASAVNSAPFTIPSNYSNQFTIPSNS
jgi:hypothetical protein